MANVSTENFPRVNWLLTLPGIFMARQVAAAVATATEELFLSCRLPPVDGSKRYFITFVPSDREVSVRMGYTPEPV
jgi:hypothetical protein